jgi:hypothetical protein
MKEIILGLLSVGMVTCYIASAVYCILNLWYNSNVIDDIIKKAFFLYFTATISMIVCGTDWIIHSDYMKVPTWQALGWGVIHVCMPYGFLLINEWICQKSSTVKCDAIQQAVLNNLTIKKTYKIM